MPDTALLFGETDTEDLIISKLQLFNKEYRDGKPSISDSEYDKLFSSAKTKWPINPFFQKVGIKGEGKGKNIPLEYIMGSLENKHHYSDKEDPSYKTGDDIDVWMEKYNNGTGFVASDKIDGVSVMVTWENGVYKHAELRGDGETGTNVTTKVLDILGSCRLPWPHNYQNIKTVVRGEIVFDANPLDYGYKNRRNSVAGIMNRDDNRHLKLLKIYFYELVTNRQCPGTVSQRFDTLKKMELDVVDYIIFKPNSKFIPQDLLNRIAKHPRDKYDIDGQVISPDKYTREDVKLPKGKVAFKAPSEFKDSVVQNVEGQISRLGRLIPVVSFNPVEIGGATLSKCSGFNYGFINDNQVGAGTKIKVCRSQEVIPYIMVVTKVNSIAMLMFPTVCPSCGTTLQWDEHRVHLLCPNVSGCPVQILKKITHFFISLGLENFRESMLKKLEVKTIFDVYDLKVEDIEELEGWGKSSAKDFVQRIQETKNVKPEFLIAALGIPGTGRTMARTLLKHFSWDQISECRISWNGLTTIDSIGEKRADVIIHGLEENKHILDGLKNIGLTIQSSGGKLKGKCFCITGKLSEPRKNIEEFIVEHGGEPTGIKNIDGMYLVCNNPSTSSKYMKAIKMGIPIITEDDLHALAT